MYWTMRLRCTTFHLDLTFSPHRIGVLSLDVTVLCMVKAGNRYLARLPTYVASLACPPKSAINDSAATTELPTNSMVPINIF